jgi:hypothetical protein
MKKQVERLRPLFARIAIPTSLLQRPIHRGLLGVAVFAVLLLAAFSLARTASADPRSFIVDPLRSPIQGRIIAKVHCSRNRNPTCVAIVISTARAQVTSHFYIDGQEYGTANRIYRKVCTKYSLSTGYHSVRVSATDTRGNIADITVANAIRCR